MSIDADSFDETKWRAETDAIMAPPPRSLVRVNNPDSAVNRARRAALTQRIYQLREWQGQLTEEAAQAALDLAELGGPIGDYSEYARSLAPLSSFERRVKRRQHVKVAGHLVPYALFFGGAAVTLVGLVVAIILFIVFLG